MKKIIIIGGGFGGLSAARALKNAAVEVTILDKSNHHLFQPLLYQVATAALSPGDIAAPIRAILRSQKNVRVFLSEALQIKPAEKKVVTSNGELDYDFLIVAVGSHHSYFGKDEWEHYAPGLKTMADALKMREKILTAFEQAEIAKSDEEINKEMTFVIVGGGPTGVELAGAIAEISKKTMLKDFRNIDPVNTKIILVEGENRLLTSFDPSLSEKAKKNLEQLGVTVKLGNRVTNINSNGVLLSDGFIETTNILWAAGNKIPEIVKSLNIESDKIGRAIVESDCSLKNHREIFVIGDAAKFTESGAALPGVAPVAIQQGKYVAKTIMNSIKGIPNRSFKYFDKGNLATIGRAKAIMQIGKLKLSGLIAWLGWVFIHILYLIGFRNRYKVLAEWIWLYFTNKNGVRLIIRETSSAD
jgi:NADH:ubiquinone reductase (H+-translocating)